MTAVIYPFFALAAVGFAAMLAVHVASLLGKTYLFERAIAVLGPGVFVVFLPTIFVMNRLAGFQAERLLACGTARLSTMDVSDSVGHFSVLLGRVFRFAVTIRR